MIKKANRYISDYFKTDNCLDFGLSQHEKAAILNFVNSDSPDPGNPIQQSETPDWRAYTDDAKPLQAFKSSSASLQSSYSTLPRQKSPVATAYMENDKRYRASQKGSVNSKGVQSSLNYLNQNKFSTNWSDSNSGTAKYVDAVVKKPEVQKVQMAGADAQ